MPRKSRPLARDSDVYRDARLIVIASEDKYAVRDYFERLKTRRVQYKVLPSDTDSSPQHILDRLDAFKSEYSLDEEDQLWYCGDTDHWVEPGHIANLMDVLTRCGQKGYHVALSNPCFEVWLLLHFADLPPGITNCRMVTQALSQLASGYSKKYGCGSSINAQMVYDAIHRATALDTDTQDVPQNPVTRVYQMLNVLIQREAVILKASP
jgi:hypothetical protein